MVAEISYDLLMDEDMSFIEGTFRVGQGEWQVVIVMRFPLQGQTPGQLEIKPTRWDSGVGGVVIRVPASVRLNKSFVEQVLGQWLGVEEWHEVRGPDSMQLR